jgi:hypothetical protein
MVALFRDHDRAGIESARALVGILVLPLPPMRWIHAVGKFDVLHHFAYIILSTQRELVALHSSI